MTGYRRTVNSLGEDTPGLPGSGNGVDGDDIDSALGETGSRAIDADFGICTGTLMVVGTSVGSCGTVVDTPQANTTLELFFPVES